MGSLIWLLLVLLALRIGSLFVKKFLTDFDTLLSMALQGLLLGKANYIILVEYIHAWLESS
jgi:hypothetical protein